MKLNNGEIYQAYHALETLSNIKLPIKQSFQIAKFLNKLEFDFKAVEKIRVEIVQKYGVAGEKEGQLVIPVDKQADFQKEITELTEMETEIGEITKVKLPDTLEVEPSILLALDKFVEM